jgi:hypothetical protein
MIEIELSKEHKQDIERVTGISYKEYFKIDADEQTRRIEEKIGHKLHYKPVTDNRILMMFRWSVLLSLNRFFETDRKKLDRRIDKILKKDKSFVEWMKSLFR